MKAAEKTRFSVTMKESEVSEVDKYSDASAIPRNEIIRRATVAYIRIKTGKSKDKDIEKAFKEVGPIDHD